MSYPSSVPLCPVCRIRMTKSIPGTGGLWACPSHGDFTGGGSASLAAASATIANAGNAVASYVPDVGTRDVLTVQGGVAAVKPTFGVTHTKVLTAAVAAGGSGGTPGAVTITGTMGTGTKFQATGTITGGGALSGVLVVTVPGDYTANPTSLTVEPITGGSLAGCTIALKMGVLTAALVAGGSVESAPTNPAVTSNTGTAAGCQLNVTYGAGATDSATIQGLAEAESGATAGNLVPGF